MTSALYRIISQNQVNCAHDAHARRHEVQDLFHGAGGGPQGALRIALYDCLQGKLRGGVALANPLGNLEDLAIVARVQRTGREEQLVQGERPASPRPGDFCDPMKANGAGAGLICPLPLVGAHFQKGRLEFEAVRDLPTLYGMMLASAGLLSQGSAMGLSQLELKQNFLFQQKAFFVKTSGDKEQMTKPNQDKIV